MLEELERLINFIEQEYMEFSKENIMKLVKEKYNNIKCISSIRGEYKAIHLYFKEDNFSFPWELQIWNKCDESANILSHAKYKQQYVEWEKKNKGGKKKW